MILSRNAGAEAISVTTIEGQRVHGGHLLIKPLIKGEQMTLLEVAYTTGVGSTMHAHTHESIVYVVRGRVRTIVDGEEYVLEAGDACRHPAGVPHRSEGIEDSITVEIKSPVPNLATLLDG